MVGAGSAKQSRTQPISLDFLLNGVRQLIETDRINGIVSADDRVNQRYEEAIATVYHRHFSTVSSSLAASAAADIPDAPTMSLGQMITVESTPYRTSRASLENPLSERPSPDANAQGFEQQNVTGHDGSLIFTDYHAGASLLPDLTTMPTPEASAANASYSSFGFQEDYLVGTDASMRTTNSEPLLQDSETLDDIWDDPMFLESFNFHDSSLTYHQNQNSDALEQSLSDENEISMFPFKTKDDGNHALRGSNYTSSKDPCDLFPS